ncbi:unnamed protein product [Cuscuta campestris]|uniref:Uncharacterized protein n=1 Tax=Cuscuta campestris TaxID=132261 RepID=A0A484NAD8_9ASTE|nr:unnamed protein product [Cuscuta campestris]
MYHPRRAMAYGRLRTPAPTIAVTLWNALYHHFAFLAEVIGSHRSTSLSLFDLSSSPCMVQITHPTTSAKLT